ncbi:DUF4260 domain-containing protein [Alkalihalophilus pseudofirmus]|uniref:DUF4260 domain-containing protein n=1 Tax=Alkalihalophilus pseudofirmus TaxID=79885 RepID=UPI00259BC04F|nr:DUF4260 domain-containing protein [Alkalihalophilus pseudofirmus]WEG15085.1 DUF4260 domain-containing protein [Alkalihalophilus pseudofirmus]
MNKSMLHIEGLAFLVLSVYFYWVNEYSWVMFFILLLAPDISMLGYLVNSKVGARCYNIFHTYSLSITIVLVGLLLTNQLVLAIGLIWSAHIGMDRAIGYGLKYSTDFKDTHLNRV